MERKSNSVQSPAEFFNNSIGALQRGDLACSVASLRSGFFENLYIAPILLNEEFKTQAIWYPGPDSEPRAARDYVSRYRTLWTGVPTSIGFLKVVWKDPLVRNELKSYVNLCKILGRVNDGRQHNDLLKERARFANPERIIRTQAEILHRISNSDLDIPTQRPHLGLIMLSSLDTAASVEFYKKLFRIEPTRTKKIEGGYAEFEFQGINLAIHGYNQYGHGDPYQLGPPPKSLGWGAFFVIRVDEFDRYYSAAIKGEIEIIDCDLEHRGKRYFVVKDPSGYVFELTEEELRGLREI